MATNSVIPAPPPGFTLDKQPQAVTPPAGFVLDDSSAQNTQPEKPMSERFAQGFGAGAGDLLISAGKLGSHIPGVKTASNLVGDVLGLPRLAPGVDPYSTVEQGTALAREKSLNNPAGRVGYATESLAEFITGDEALKGLSYGDKLLHAARLTKMLEKTPKVLRAVEIGLNAARAGTVGTIQGGAHGESLSDSLESGALAAGTSGLIETGIEGVKAIAPTVRKLAGSLIPVRASQESALANAAENVANSKSLRKFDVEQTQPGAKKALGKIASDIEPASPVSNAAPLKPAANIGERADQIRAQVKPVFEKLDDLTKDRDLTFSDLQKQERVAYRRADFDTATAAREKQQAILAEFQHEFDPKDLTNARKAWAQASALDRVDGALNTKAVLKPTPVEFRPQGVDPGVIDGKQFSKAILDLKNKGALQTAGMTADHVQDLTDLGTLLEKGANVKRVSNLFQPRNAALAEGLGFLLHPATAVAAAKVGVPTYAASRILGGVMTNPKAAKALVNILRFADETVPGIAAQIPSGNPRAITDDAKDMISNAVSTK